MKILATLVSRLREQLLSWSEFQDWASHPDKFKLIEREPRVYDLHLDKLPGKPLKVTPHALATDLPKHMKTLNVNIEQCTIQTGSPDGGVLRIKTS